jgi:hypothetical protein
VTAPLTRFWVHDVVITRNPGVYGTGGISETVRGFVRDGSRLVLGPDGQNVVSTAQVAVPAGTAYVEPGAKVTLPAQFGSRTCTVITTEVADGGTLPTPNHVLLMLA